MKKAVSDFETIPCNRPSVKLIISVICYVFRRYESIENSTLNDIEEQIVRLITLQKWIEDTTLSIIILEKENNEVMEMIKDPSDQTYLSLEDLRRQINKNLNNFEESANTNCD